MRMRQALLGIAFLAVLVPASALASVPALTQAKIPTIGVALQVPAGWVESAPTAKLASQHVVEVYHPKTATSGYLANLTVIVAAVSPRITLREWLLGSQSAKFLLLGTLSRFRFKGASGLSYTSSKLESFRGSPVLIDEYGFLHGTRGYLFTYTSLGTAKLAAPEALFGASAATIHFVVTPVA
ncbi:MAG TPA: hypothetical protein VMV08_05875 [Gaiellaceae bacterium]|nr:hypothetical protein [Gaiellaceae bacterium]